MISLKDQDQFNGSNKRQMLIDAVGERFSDNHSSTGASVLVMVCEDDTVVTKEVASEYKSNTTKPKPGLKCQPDWLVWNGLFY
tara:strand:+ start:1062 stop:1310 length:249 start_codon:yes stop_codon:yes gene_type:complete